MQTALHIIWRRAVNITSLLSARHDVTHNMHHAANTLKDHN